MIFVGWLGTVERGPWPLPPSLHVNHNWCSKCEEQAFKEYYSEVFKIYEADDQRYSAFYGMLSQVRDDFKGRTFKVRI